MSIDPRDFGQPTPYPPAFGGLFQALALAGQSLAQGLLARRQLDTEEQDREMRRQLFELQKRREESELSLNQPFGDFFKDNPDISARISKYPALAKAPYRQVWQIVAQNPDRFPDLAEPLFGIKPDFLDSPAPPELVDQLSKRFNIPPDRLRGATWRQINGIIPGGVARWMATQNAPLIGEIMPQHKGSPIGMQRTPVDELGNPDYRALEALFRFHGVDPPRTPQQLEEAKQNYIARRQKQLADAVEAGDTAQVVRVAQALTAVGVPTDPRPHIKRAEQAAKMRGAQAEVAGLQPTLTRAQIESERAQAAAARASAARAKAGGGLSQDDIKSFLMREYLMGKDIGERGQRILFGAVGEEVISAKDRQILQLWKDNIDPLTGEPKDTTLAARLKADVDRIVAQITTPIPTTTGLPAEASAFIADAVQKKVPLAQVEAWAKQNRLNLDLVRQEYNREKPPAAPSQRGSRVLNESKRVRELAQRGQPFPEPFLRQQGFTQQEINSLRAVYNQYLSRKPSGAKKP